MRKLSNSLTLVLFITGFGTMITIGAKAYGNSYSDSTPVTANKDAKTIVSDYINAIGGLDAIKKINSTSATGTISVQGMALDVKQERMAPNKTLQTVIMNGTTVAKTMFDGTKGYQEQMGNHTDMAEEDMADLKTQAYIIPQADYLTNTAYKLFTQGVEKVADADAYKVLVTMPSGKIDTEYYDIASKLLVKQIMPKTVSGQNVMTTYSFSDYRKAGDVMLPYKMTLGIAAGAMNQSIAISLNDVKINEGVAETDFQ